MQYAYMIQNISGDLIIQSARKTRSGCVLFWTGVWKSEKCKDWQFAKKKGVKIVRVKIERA